MEVKLPFGRYSQHIAPAMLHSNLVSMPLTAKSEHLRLGSSSNVGFSLYPRKPVVRIPLRRRRDRPVIRASKTDYYKTLRVGKNANLQEIKSSYRKLARKVWDLLGRRLNWIFRLPSAVGGLSQSSWMNGFSLYFFFCYAVSSWYE